ncbi:MAG: hypothetical protein K0R18_2523 [Bacillales bacterium]|jgi:hypothetical protein|nr:hypothetical protein [Bacillales bacterium]
MKSTPKERIFLGVDFNMKKKIFLTMGIVFLVFLQYSSTNAQTSNDLIMLQTLIKKVKPNIQIEQCNIQVREIFQQTEIEIQDKLNKRFHNILWIEKEKLIKGVLKNSYDGLNCEFNIIPICEVSEEGTLLIAKFSAKNEILLKSNLLQSTITSTCFTEEAEIFSCLKGTINGTMDKDLAYIVDEFIEIFQASIIEKMSEKGFTSVSAKSLFFKNDLDNNMNIQIALRNSAEHNQTILTVGTPIITEEY